MPGLIRKQTEYWSAAGRLQPRSLHKPTPHDNN